MTDFEYARSQAIAGSEKLSSKSPYKGWSVDKFDSLLSGLHKVINLKKKNGVYRLRSFACSSCGRIVGEYQEGRSLKPLSGKAGVLDFKCTFGVVFYNRGDRAAKRNPEFSSPRFPIPFHPFAFRAFLAHCIHQRAFWHIDCHRAGM